MKYDESNQFLFLSNSRIGEGRGGELVLLKPKSSFPPFLSGILVFKEFEKFLEAL